jgi:hypothetical protein
VTASVGFLSYSDCYSSVGFFIVTVTATVVLVFLATVTASVGFLSYSDC